MDSTAPPPCPFCNIASSYPPTPFNDPESNPVATAPDSGPLSYIILSTEHVLAFLDIMPLTRGHVLVAPRNHYKLLGDMGVQAGQEVLSYFPSLYLYLFEKCFFCWSFSLIRCIDGEMAAYSLQGCNEDCVWRWSRQTLECCTEQWYVLPLLFAISGNPWSLLYLNME